MLPENLSFEAICNWMNDHGWWGFGAIHPHKGRIYDTQREKLVPDQWGISFYDYTRDDGYHGVLRAQGDGPDLITAARMAAAEAEKLGFH